MCSALEVPVSGRIPTACAKRNTSNPRELSTCGDACDRRVPQEPFETRMVARRMLKLGRKMIGKGTSRA
jgi:hypothetical protein